MLHKRSTITISSIHGTRVIRTHRFVVFLGVGLLFSMMVGLIGGTFLVDYLQEQKDYIQRQYADMHIKYKSMTTKYNNQRVYSNTLSEELLHNENIQSAIMTRLNVLANVLEQKKTNDIFASPQFVGFNSASSYEYKEVFGVLDNEIHRRARVLYALPSGTPLAKDTYISSSYGVRIHPLRNYRQFHHGIDLPIRMRDSVVATSPGTVTFTGYKGGYGKVVILEHAYGFSTVYGHLDEYLVSKGDVVQKGEQIALGGNTGISTGPHVHYEVRYLDKPINPYLFYNWNLVNYNKIFLTIKSVKWEPIIAAILQQQDKEGLRLSLQGLL